VADSEWLGDFGASHRWPEGLEEHLDGYRQGHLIASIPLFFAGTRSALWKPPRRELATGPPAIVGEERSTVPYAMLLTQTCDLMKGNAPWGSVAPVYEGSQRLSEDQLASARSGQTQHLVHITAGWAHDGCWVADLRLEFPIEKSLLLTRTPIEAFADEADYARLAQRLATRRERPALPETCLEYVVGPLFDALRRHRRDTGLDLRAGTREIRVQCNDTTSPSVVVVFVVVDDNAVARVDRGAWTELIGNIYAAARAVGLTIMGPELTTLWEMTAHDYLTSALIEDAQSS